MAFSQRRRWVLAALTFVAVLLVPSLAVSAGKEEVVIGQDSPFSLDFGISPKALPRSEPFPVKLTLSAGFAPPAGSAHPAAASQLTVLLDHVIDVTTRGLPACAPTLQIMSVPPIPERCKPALVGRGRMEISIAFPGAEELRQRPHLLIYNGGSRDNSARLWIYAWVSLPVPASILIPVDLAPLRQGRYGTTALLSIPKIAGGAGSIASIRLRIDRQYRAQGERRSVISARCPDGKLQIAAAASFADGSPSVSEEEIRACRGFR